MDQIKILQVIRPAEGGMKEHLLSLVKGLKDRMRVAVACPQESSIYQQVCRAGLEVFPVSLPGEFSPAKDFKAAIDLHQILRKNKFDIIHCHSSKAALVGRIAANLAKTPIKIFTVHNSIFQYNTSHLKKFLFAQVENILSFSTDMIITVSKDLSQEIISIEKVNPSKVITIYNGINFPENYDDQKIFKEKYNLTSQLIIGTVARLAPQKGLHFLIEAFNQVCQENKYNLALVIIGDGPLSEELKNKAKELKIDKNIIFTGYQSDAAKLLQIFDIFVLSSLTEGLPLTILEAMAAKVPIISTGVGGIPEVIVDRKNGLLVKPADSYQLAEGIKILLKDEALRKALAKNASEDVRKQFSIQNMVNNTATIYYQLLSQKGLL